MKYKDLLIITLSPPQPLNHLAPRTRKLIMRPTRRRLLVTDLSQHALRGAANDA